MRSHLTAAVLAVLLVTPSLGAAQARTRPEARETSADLLRRDRAARAASARSDAQAPAATGLAATGDADSFGRSMKYLGVAQTLTVELLPDCTGTSPDSAP